MVFFFFLRFGILQIFCNKRRNISAWRWASNYLCPNLNFLMDKNKPHATFLNPTLIRGVVKNLKVGKPPSPKLNLGAALCPFPPLPCEP